MSLSFTFIDLGQLSQHELESHVSLNSGKFVQIQHEELGEFLVFAPLQLCSFHARIIDLFSQLQTPQWAFELNLKKDDGTLHEEHAHIVGGGYFDILTDRKRINLSGQSLAFGDYEAYGLPEKMSSIERFSDYKIFC
jgi:hypothetical protein